MKKEPEQLFFRLSPASTVSTLSLCIVDFFLFKALMIMFGKPSLVASVFAYGQTSSGKTFTMSGITEYTMEDIFAYTQKVRKKLFIIYFTGFYAQLYPLIDALYARSTKKEISS